MNFTIKNGLPKSHSCKTVTIGERVLNGIVWDQKDVHENDRTLLYKKWASVHFDSDWYEIAAAPVSNEKNTARDITLLKSFFGNKLNDRTALIDVNCGNSRHLIKLAQENIYGVGMEGASLLRKMGQDKARMENLPLEIVSTSKHYRDKYANSADIVTSLFNSMGYTFNINDDIRRLRWMINLLKPKGYFLLDVRAEEFQIQHFSNPQVMHEEMHLSSRLGKTPVTMKTQKFWKDGILAAEELISVGSKNEVVAQNTTYGWKTYSLKDLQFILEEVGMRLLEHRLDYYSVPKNMGERIFLLSQKMD